MNVAEFVAKWSKSELRESQAAQSHFNDLCRLLGQDEPAAADPAGDWFCFERGATKHGGGEGWADVWKKGFFGWEYKGKHKNLDAAYDQLLQYRNELENPPLLVVSDMDRIIIHTNYTNTKAAVFEVCLANLQEPRSMEILRAVFEEPDHLKPGAGSRVITEEAAGLIAQIAQSLRDRGAPSHDVAHFLDRIVFCLFAEDVGLLPARLFTRILENTKDKPAVFYKSVQTLFEAMAHGGLFGADSIAHFNGNLFDSTAVLELTPPEIQTVLKAALLDWDAVDPSIFGTLFERGLDPDKRSQLGAHYTSRADIETLVEPVVMTPLRRDWATVKNHVESLLTTGKKAIPQPPDPLLPPGREGGVSASVSPLPFVGEGPGVRGDVTEGPVMMRVRLRASDPQLRTELAREFRKKATPSEAMLWQALRNRKLVGRRFRRQEPIGSFIVDFFCAEEKLVVEVDGPIHELQEEQDQARQELLEQTGLRFLRLKSDDVMNDPAGCLRRIAAAFGKAPQPPSPLLPPGREGGAAGVSPQPPSPLLPPGREGGAGASVSPLTLVGEGLGVREKQAPLKPQTLKKAREEAVILIHDFLLRLAAVRVLDPACGSGNFLYVTLQKLKDLEKEAILYANMRLGVSYLPMVGPWQMHGIEINPYAHDLAQMTVWIGYLQWTRANGFGVTQDPILRPLDNFQCMDAILDLSDPEHPEEPEWPAVDFIVGNPPFLGSQMMRGELGDSYVDKLRKYYDGRLTGGVDLCCYWYEKARSQVEAGKCSRAGLLATQGIRGGASREVLKRIKETGEIFFAVSDREWILDGANVHVSMVGFDDGTEKDRVIDNEAVGFINANLTSKGDLTCVVRFKENLLISYQGDNKVGKFEIDFSTAGDFLISTNPHGKPNSDVVRPWVNGISLTQKWLNIWIIDFPPSMPIEEAARYEAPFEYLKRVVFPVRSRNKRGIRARNWWIHGDPQKAMRRAVRDSVRFVCTPRVSKFRIFVRIDSPFLADSATYVFARSDDYFFGVLHSRLHEVWALAQGTQLREKESGFRYTPTTCFETFPLPHPTPEQEATIGAAAKELDDLRRGWLNPPEWTREEVLEFPGSADGPWARFVHDPDARGIGTVRWPRVVAKDEASAKLLAKRTLTNLYNQRPAWLDLAHKKLDAAVFAAYGWPDNLTDEEILEKLLALNLERAGR